MLCFNVMYSTVICLQAMWFAVRYCTVMPRLPCTVLRCTVQFSPVLYVAEVCIAVLCCALLYSTWTVLHCNALSWNPNCTVVSTIFKNATLFPATRVG